MRPTTLAVLLVLAATGAIACPAHASTLLPAEATPTTVTGQSPKPHARLTRGQRIVAETGGAVFGAIMGTVVGVVVGSAIDGSDHVFATGILGGGGLMLGTSAGVWAVGEAAGADGTYWTTLLGATAGLAVGMATGGVPAVVTLPAGAILGYESSAERETSAPRVGLAWTLGQGGGVLSLGGAW